MDKKQTEEPSFFVKFLLLMGVVIVAGVILFISSLILPKSDTPSGYISCETRLDSTACPDPNDELDKEVENTIRSYPDDSY